MVPCSSFPQSRIYAWKPTDTCYNATQAVLSANSVLFPIDCQMGMHLTAHPFNVNVLLKKGKPTGLQQDGMRARGEALVKNETTILFFRFHDCKKVCILPRDKMETTECVEGDPVIEDLLTTSADLVTRVSWNADGFRYLIGDYIVGMCTVHKSGTDSTMLIEITCANPHNAHQGPFLSGHSHSHSHSHSTSTTTGLAVLTEMDSLAKEIIPMHVQHSVRTYFTEGDTIIPGTGTGTGTGRGSSHTLANRAVNWAKALLE